jgi:predicted DNA-binding transcriptional regulator YafY
MIGAKDGIMTATARRERLLNLLHRGATTVPRAAETLGVSERTVHRDIAWLRRAGHTVQATPGPGGGVSVAPDSRPRAVHFEVAEIIGLTLSVALLKATPHQPFARSAEAALDRAHRALSLDRQRALRRLQRRILVAAEASPAVKATLGEVDEGLLLVFEACFTGERSMAFDYVDRHGAATRRRIECVGLVNHAPAWYIVAWDLDKAAPRLFRLDRIVAAHRAEPLDDRHTFAEVVAIACPDADPVFRDWLGTPLG